MSADDLLNIILQNPDKYRRQLDKMLAAESLIDYIKVVWDVLEPSVEFSHGWHIDCVTEHLTAVTNGEINRLLINVPPGSAKPVWEEEKVTTNRGLIKLKDIKVGDMVLTHRCRFKKVENVHIQGILPTLKISTHYGEELVLAYEHPVLTTRGWVKAKDLTLGDLVATVFDDSIEYRIEYHQLNSIEESGERPCRCLTVADDHSFVVNDIAVHNSLLTSVFWPSWEWGPKGMPWNQFLTFSYSKKLALRDNIKCRTLIKSPRYQELWGDVFKLSTDVKAKEKFGNDKNGFKEISSVGGTGTGLRGDRVIIDDPHSVKQGDSDAQMNTALTWFNETLPTRLNDQKKSAIVVIMQRINERDISGEILSKNLGYTHVMIPMYFEPERRCYTVVWPGGYKNNGELYLWDKRENDGDLMWPEKFPEEEVNKLSRQLGDYAVAGQLQQRPAPREGAMFKNDDVQIIPAEKVPAGFEVRGWDLAGSTDSKSPFSAGVKIRFDANDNFYIMDVVRFRGKEKRVVDVMRSTAEKDGEECIQDFPQDPGQAGKGQAVYITEQLFGFPVKYSLESGNKVIRAEAAASQAGIKKMFIVEGDWNDAFIKELTKFPGCRFKDQIDAMSRAFHRGLTMRETKQDEIVSAPISI
ncbi:MAG: phage terminase large subunit [Clostridium sp.]|nr:phage terminase large subunit [Clostridium sp.]